MKPSKVRTYQFTLESQEQTKLLAEQVAIYLKGGDLLLLQGDLGAGKTTFTSFLVAALGGDPELVSSPTFTIMQTYALPASETIAAVHHFDFYRLETEADFWEAGLGEYLADEEALVIVEWPELLPQVLPEKRIVLELKKPELGADYAQLAQSLASQGSISLKAPSEERQVKLSLYGSQAYYAKWPANEMSFPC